MARNVGRKELLLRKDDYERQKNVPLGMQLGVARETGQVAQNTTVHIRVAEAKNLPAKDISGTSDPFCILRVDNQEVARTATVWKSLSPFWGEDFTLHIPRGFHNISVYVYDEDLVGQDDIIGKLSLSHSTVTKSVKGVDGWFPLQPIVKDEEVQGDLEVEFKLEGQPGRECLHVQVLQARDLAAKDTSGTSDPFVKFTFRGQTYKTEVMKKTLYPKWYQRFSIPLATPLQEDEMINLVLWDWDRMSHNDFLGQARVCVGNLDKSNPRIAWYRLVARKSSPNLSRTMSQSPEDLGSLRIMVLVREDTILPSQYYKPLLDLMAKSVMQPWTKYANVVTMFEETAVADKTEMATIMIKLYLGQGKVVEFLDFLNQRDLETSEKSTLFRGNSFATKANDQFMKVVGSKYLEQVLKPVIDLIYDEKKNCEIDPTKIEVSGRQTADSAIEANVATLASYVLRAIKAIFGSVRQCPPVMRLAFKRLRKRVEERFPLQAAGDENVYYLALSGFLFLRFFAPAILSPKLFFLKDAHPDKKTSRTLTLVAKAIQNIGNLGGQLHSAKELFMKPLHPLIRDNVGQLKVFLDQLVDISDSLDDHSIVGYNSNATLVIKEGHLMKKKGSSLALDVVGSMAMQRRYCWLSRFTLMYGKSADANDKDKHSLSVQRMLAVEPVDPAAFQTTNTFQIVYQLMQNKIETYYFVARDVNEQQQWISSLRKVCLQNRDMWPIYHPGAMRKGKWTCCQHTDKNAVGCSKSHGGVILGNYQDPLDPEAEAQTVYSQLWNGFQALRSKYCPERPFPSPSIASPSLEADQFTINVPSGSGTQHAKPESSSGAQARKESMHQAMSNPVAFRRTGDQDASSSSPVLGTAIDQSTRVQASVKQVEPSSSGNVRMHLQLRQASFKQAILQGEGEGGGGEDTDTWPADTTSCDAPAAAATVTSVQDELSPVLVLPAVSALSGVPEADEQQDEGNSSTAAATTPTKASPTSDAGDGTPKQRRKRSLRNVLSDAFTGSSSPGSSPKLLRSQSASSPSKPPASKQEAGQSPLLRRGATSTEALPSAGKPSVVRLRSLGSVVRTVEVPAGMELPAEASNASNGANGGLHRHQTAPELGIVSDGDSTRCHAHELHPQFSNLSVNSLDSLMSPVSTTPGQHQHTLPAYVAHFVSEDNDHHSLPLHQPTRAMSEMLLDELERLYNAHTVYEAMPRRLSVLESA
ncbi:rasGAP-activating-like protein 1 [Sycon ciliatum]|uniref:rasGAP-activating-like protein 1 n=1 Tax=Sycon ciliatum TaxID=27933 RepID=UPI0020AC1384|eukprot:scpid18810/ scgid0206/ RasGAP-activating-like protein 1